MSLESGNKLMIELARRDTTGYVHSMEMQLSTIENPKTRAIWIIALRDGARAWLRLADRMEAKNDL